MKIDVTVRSAECMNVLRSPYTAPRLVVYGSLTEITRAVGISSKKDGGSVNGMKNSQK